MAKAAAIIAAFAFCAFVADGQPPLYPTNFAYQPNYGYPVNYGYPPNFAYPPNSVYSINVFYPTNIGFPNQFPHPSNNPYPNSNTHANITTVKPLGRLDFCVPIPRGGLDCTYRYETYDYWCQNIFATKNAVSFDTHGKCMFLFEERDCKGRHFRALPSPDKFHVPIANTTWSYKLC
uniref:Uncharacterized protein n=1 Tax=Panagrellus redivivus TaxID=6233 RepID=A0A7E4VGU8_PANRE